jgi:hypothetical protein
MNPQEAEKMTSPFRQLLARYLSGQISETEWKRIMRTFDVQDLKGSQRVAYARLFNEMFARPSNGHSLTNLSV